MIDKQIDEEKVFCFISWRVGRNVLDTKLEEYTADFFLMTRDRKKATLRNKRCKNKNLLEDFSLERWQQDG